VTWGGRLWVMRRGVDSSTIHCLDYVMVAVFVMRRVLELHHCLLSCPEALQKEPCDVHLHETC
jgi:hypothetical protein